MDRPAILLARLALILAAASLVPATTPAPLLGQEEFDYPTPEEYAEARDEAERAPLFLDEEPIRMTLRTDIKWLRDERNDSVQVEGTLTFIDSDGAEVVQPIQTRARGNFRRSKKNCRFPPLRLNFKKNQVGSVSEPHPAHFPKRDDTLKVGGFSDMVFEVMAAWLASGTGTWVDKIRQFVVT